MTTAATEPTYAPPKRETLVYFTLTNGSANFVRVWVTQAPPGSALRKKLDSSTQSRFLAYEGDGGTAEPWRNTFDVGGKYTFVAQEYTRGAAPYGGGYLGSPDGYQSETKVGSESTVTLFIGQRLTSKISTSDGVSATVVLWVWDGTIRETTLAVHGEASPAMLVEQPTPRAIAAAESATVTAALDALIGATVSTAVGDPASLLATFVGTWAAHVADAAAHEDADADNVIPGGLGSATIATSALAQSVNEVIQRVRYHFTNDAALGGTVSGRDTGNYHNVSGKKNDNVNMPLVAGASGVSDAYWAIAELYRVYSAHRTSLAVHDVASTAGLGAYPALLSVGTAFFGVVASTSPTVPPAQSSGAMTLIASAGFEESPL